MQYFSGSGSNWAIPQHSSLVSYACYYGHCTITAPVDGTAADPFGQAFDFAGPNTQALPYTYTIEMGYPYTFTHWRVAGHRHYALGQVRLNAQPAGSSMTLVEGSQTDYSVGGGTSSGQHAGQLSDGFAYGAFAEVNALLDRSADAGPAATERSVAERALADALRILYPHIPLGSSVLDAGCGWCGPATLLAAQRAAAFAAAFAATFAAAFAAAALPTPTGSSAVAVAAAAIAPAPVASAWSRRLCLVLLLLQASAGCCEAEHPPVASCDQTLTGSSNVPDNLIGHADHIYEFCTAVSGVYTFNSCGSSFDTYLRVRTQNLTLTLTLALTLALVARCGEEEVKEPAGPFKARVLHNGHLIGPRKTAHRKHLEAEAPQCIRRGLVLLRREPINKLPLRANGDDAGAESDTSRPGEGGEGGAGGGGAAGYIHGKSGVHVHIHGVLLASIRGVGGVVPLVALRGGEGGTSDHRRLDEDKKSREGGPCGRRGQHFRAAEGGPPPCRRPGADTVFL